MIVFTEHALLKLLQRGIARHLIIQTLDKPDYETKGYGNRKLVYRRFGKLYLLVVYKREDNNLIIITQYWVAKIKK